jgi:ABC-type glycerol-3-phosphate transport system substrate-binding protein
VEFAKRHPSFNWLPFAKVEIGPDEGTRLLRELYQLVLAAPAIRLMNQEQSGPGISDALYKKLQEMVIGSITPEQAAKDIQAVYEKIVEAEAQLRK